MEQSKEIRNNTFYRIRNINLITIQLNLILIQINIALYLREVEDTGQMERIVYIQMNPEQRFVWHRIKLTIEFFIIFVRQFTRFLCPQRNGVIDDIIFRRLYLFAVFPLFLFTKSDGNGQEAAIFLQEGRDAWLLEKLLAIIINIQYDICTTIRFLHLFKCKLRTTVASPFYGLCTFFIWFGDNFNLLGNHECRVEPKSEVSNDGIRIVFIFFKEIVSSRKGNLVDIFINLFSSQTDTTIGDGNGVFA